MFIATLFFSLSSLESKCELGAMPPFGNLYGMEVYAARRLSGDREIAFNAGSQMELIRLAYPDFEHPVSPEVGDPAGVRLRLLHWQEHAVTRAGGDEVLLRRVLYGLSCRN